MCIAQKPVCVASFVCGPSDVVPQVIHSHSEIADQLQALLSEYSTDETQSVTRGNSRGGGGSREANRSILERVESAVTETW